MLPINLLSFARAEASLSAEAFDAFTSHHEISISASEICDITTLVDGLHSIATDYSVFDRFFVGYRIPQIGKEFDLLRFGSNKVVNIEVKSKSTDQAIKRQLTRNKYYLSFVSEKSCQFCFISSSNQIYQLNAEDEIECVDLQSLYAQLTGLERESFGDIDQVFDPSAYLVSPFNSPDRFLKSQYFLTNQQEDIKREVISTIRDRQAARISITGAAGTGKTLLVYDLARTLNSQSSSAALVHCGNLNVGHAYLNDRGWNVVPVKIFRSIDYRRIDVLILDEAQRIWPNQLDEILDKSQENNVCCIFSYDKEQTLSRVEIRRDIDKKIRNITGVRLYSLSEKIRTNHEIAKFIKLLFQKRKDLKSVRSSNIVLNYFSTIDDAKKYLSSLDENYWKILGFTPSQYENEHHESYTEFGTQTSHGVIGQEFDGVSIVIDSNFHYDADGVLRYASRTYYSALRMLFQNITRTRKRLNIVIIDNEELLRRCVEILIVR